MLLLLVHHTAILHSSSTKTAVHQYILIRDIDTDNRDVGAAPPTGMLQQYQELIAVDNDVGTGSLLPNGCTWPFRPALKYRVFGLR